MSDEIKVESEELEEVSDADLEGVAGGGIFDWIEEGISYAADWVSDNMISPVIEFVAGGSTYVVDGTMDALGVRKWLENNGLSAEDVDAIHIVNPESGELLAETWNAK